ncbi:C40 family peptidase [Colibacter massiliensis]|uniref:C40 family peptidase n=1 Tax=Colibacter massiliensis TaxID=1852379 RepID=UPI0023575C20|nr:NlpC/P60 family protein [Colibacter massiliensis]
MWRAISKTAIACAVAVLAVLPVGAYSVGSQGADVLLIQKQLVKRGYKISADGIYGSETSRAVGRFQADKGLDISGNVDAKTYKLLTGKAMPKAEKKAVSGGKNKKKAVTIQDYGKGKAGKGDIKHNVFGNKVVSQAYQYLGVPYVFGGNTPNGFDCSGFTKYVFAHSGVTLPRMADEQYRLGAAVSKRDLIPGDLVFFTTYESGISHTGIYVGNNQFISATSSSGIHVDSLNSEYWRSRYVGAKRIKK